MKMWIITKGVDDLKAIFDLQVSLFTSLIETELIYIFIQCTINVFIITFTNQGSGKRFSNLILLKLASNYHFKVYLSLISIYPI